MAEFDDELARISHLIEDINYDYVQAAYWTRQCVNFEIMLVESVQFFWWR